MKRITAAVLAAIVSVLGVAVTASPAEAGPQYRKADTGWD
jgi:hypothetical protein